MKRLAGKVAVVTGGASGLGAAIAERLSLEGATVVITDIRSLDGDGNTHGASFLPHDVTNENRWNAVIQEVERCWGALHILVNNAGIEGPFERADPETTDLRDWQAIHRVNVEGVFLGCRAAIPAIRRAGGGSLINMSSTAGLSATPDYIAYGASKAAVRHLTKSIAVYCARNASKIRCNSVHPGLIRTPMLNRIVEERAKHKSTSITQELNQFLAHIPQGEFQEAKDVAAVIAFLASDEAKHITGTSQVVDGGCTLGF